jgi:hypothetical protein
MLRYTNDILANSVADLMIHTSSTVGEHGKPSSALYP